MFQKIYSVNETLRLLAERYLINDVFLRLLIMSDHIVSSFYKVPMKKIKSLSAEATELLSFSKKVEEESDSETDCSHSSDSD